MRLLLEYDGSRFSGFQFQPEGRTVAGELSRALAGILGEEVRLVGAARTDEGVHAEGQVANFLTRSPLPCRTIHEKLVETLPQDVNVLAVENVGPEFHSRHSASARVYRYVITRRHSVFTRGRAWTVVGKLNPALLKACAARVLGLHDFGSFTDRRLLGAQGAQVEISHADWKETREGLVFRVAAGHFLPRMVRRLVGAMVRVAKGEATLEEFQDLIDRPRLGAVAAFTAPGMGLYLQHVEYPREPAAGRGELAPAARRAVAAYEALETPDD